MEKLYEWPEHIYNTLTKDTFGYTVTPYSIALEGWRRGLELTFHQTKERKSEVPFTLKSSDKSHRFSASRGDKVTRQAVRICKNKYETKKYLEENNIPTPKGQVFDGDAKLEKIVEYSEEIGYPVVIKPVDGTGGKGVITNIKNRSELESNLKYLKEDLNYKDIIVENYFMGEDYRVYVVGEQSVGATKRIAPNVIGDGRSTIKELIKFKNQEKIDSKLYKSSLIKVDKEVRSFLTTQGLTLSSVIEEGKRIFVKSKNNVTAGGDPVDATDELSSYAKEVAVDAAKSIPTLVQAGVDIMVNQETGEVTVIEINSRPNIRLNLFPIEGKGRDIPKAIIDYYFPDTKQNLTSPLYYDYGDMWKKLKKEGAKNVDISDHPKGQLLSKRYIVRKNMRYMNYGKWLVNLAEKHQIYGYVKHLANDSTSIIAVGTEANLKTFYEAIKQPKEDRFIVDNIEVKSRKSPVLNKFYIDNIELDVSLEEGYHPVSLKQTKNIKKKTNKTKSKVKVSKKQEKKETIDYEKEYKKVVNSTSWKITQPLRKLAKKIKK